MKTNQKFSTRLICEIAIMTAIGFALDFLQGGYSRGLFVNGGSIGIAMLPILILAYRRGFIPALISGIILAFLQMLGGIYAIADTWYNVFFQIALDYILAYPVVAFAGLFKKKFDESNKNKQNLYLVLGTIVGGLIKLLCHYLAGIIFWGSSAPDNFLGGKYLYSLVYNGGFMLPNIILCAVLLIIINNKAPFILKDDKGELAHE